MNTDIRLSVDFFDHPKTIKLQRRLGLDGVHCLLRLWLFAAKHKSSGELADMDVEEIALAAKWPNDPSTFVTTLVEIRYVDVTDDRYSLHDWIDHNGYASSAVDRSDKSRFSRMAKTHKPLYDALKAQGYEAITAEEYKKLTAPNRVSSNESLNEKLTTVERTLNESLTNPVSPSPSPSPSPTPSPTPLPSPLPSPSFGEGIERRGNNLVQSAGPTEAVMKKVLDWFNKVCTDLPNAKEVTGMRRHKLQLFFARYQANDGGAFPVIDAVFNKVHASDKLSGRNGNKRWCTFDWIIELDNAARIIEGQFDNSLSGKKGVNLDDRKRAFLGPDAEA